jgi:16S rRNA C967 or C1407 C5-methylase (RsmB/RsmF family)
VVYSTCSINSTENDQACSRVLGNSYPSCCYATEHIRISTRRVASFPEDVSIKGAMHIDEKFHSPLLV